MKLIVDAMLRIVLGIMAVIQSWSLMLFNDHLLIIVRIETITSQKYVFSTWSRDDHWLSSKIIKDHNKITIRSQPWSPTLVKKISLKVFFEIFRRSYIKNLSIRSSWDLKIFFWRFIKRLPEDFIRRSSEDLLTIFCHLTKFFKFFPILTIKQLTIISNYPEKKVLELFPSITMYHFCHGTLKIRLFSRMFPWIFMKAITGKLRRFD